MEIGLELRLRWYTKKKREIKMKLLIVICCFLSLVFVQSEEIQRAVTIKTEEQSDISAYLADIYDAIEYAYENGSGSEGRMDALDQYLLYRTEVPKKWICIENADGLSHLSSEFYGYFKVTKTLLTYSVKLICLDCE
nr:uncharacterized protein LOC111421469 isoform X2 [Onthophagus taurus]XP_022910417.1 uncharacterized protein LOC111421469 isoform X2 [Onthophagus taurus]